MNDMRRAFITISFTLLLSALFAQTEREWYSMGQAAMDKGDYIEAVNAFENYIAESKWPEDAFLQLGIAYFESSQLPLAEKYLSYVMKEKPQPRAILYYAKLLHSQNKFAEAAEYYKQYLAEGQNMAFVKKQILHCRSGLRMKGQMSRAFVDNLGPMINTKHDEVAPVLSPNHPGRLYFSSASEKSEGGKRDPNGFRNDEFGDFTFDMFRVEQENGIWGEVVPLNPILNTPRNEILYGFTNNGLVAFFFRGFNLKFGEIVTDTFQVENKEQVKNPSFNSPADANFGDKDLFFVNDSTFIFSSVRESGMGGYDLYICMKKDGKWSAPASLGPTINSPYHERTPHISKNGDFLFFSSDRPGSIGGFDVFSAKWDRKGWKNVQNLGKGINSAMDDLYFTSGTDEYSAYFSSNRKEGYGGFDLYGAFFKEPVFESTRMSLPDMSFYFAREDFEKKPGSGKFEKWSLRPLIFKKEQEELEPAQEEIIASVAQKMKAHPDLELNLLCFSAYDGPKKYDLYFGMKRGENLSQELIRRGISGQRITITGCGSAYPVVLDAGTQDHREEGNLNRRVDFKFSQSGELPFELKYDELVEDNILEGSPYQEFHELIAGLSYSVQIAASQQLYEGTALKTYRNPLIRTKAGDAVIKYTIGIFDNYDEARNLRYRLMKDGYKGVFVTAYIDGIRKTRDELRQYVDEYADLRGYINVE